MREQLEALAKELRDLKREGVDSVYIADDTISDLKRALPLEACVTERADVRSPAVRDKASIAAAFQRGAEPEQEKAFVVVKKKRPVSSVASDIPSPPHISLPEGDKQMQWNWLKEKMFNDSVCNREKAASKKLVFGSGSLDADILFCADTPGEMEENKGEPFVGDAGLLLSKIIKAMGLSRESVYLSYVMQWRPQSDSPISKRVTTSEELAYCLPYLKAQVEIVRPKIIVALGNATVSALLGPDPSRKMAKVRGQFLDYEASQILPTYHPSYVLEYGTQKVKRTVWEDMLSIMEELSLPISDKQRGFFK